MWWRKVSFILMVLWGSFIQPPNSSEGSVIDNLDNLKEVDKALQHTQISLDGLTDLVAKVVTTDSTSSVFTATSPTVVTSPSTKATTPSTVVTSTSTKATTPSTVVTSTSTKATTPSTVVTSTSTKATTPSTVVTSPSTKATTSPSVDTSPSTEEIPFLAPLIEVKNPKEFSLWNLLKNVAFVIEYGDEDLDHKMRMITDGGGLSIDDENLLYEDSATTTPATTKLSTTTTITTPTTTTIATTTETSTTTTTPTTTSTTPTTTTPTTPTTTTPTTTTPTTTTPTTTSTTPTTTNPTTTTPTTTSTTPTTSLNPTTTTPTTTTTTPTTSLNPTKTTLTPTTSSTPPPTSTSASMTTSIPVPTTTKSPKEWRALVQQVLEDMSKVTDEINEGQVDHEHAYRLDELATSMDELVQEGEEDHDLLEEVHLEDLSYINSTLSKVNDTQKDIKKQIDTAEDDKVEMIVSITMLSVLFVVVLVGLVISFIRPWAGGCRLPRSKSKVSSSVPLDDSSAFENASFNDHSESIRLEETVSNGTFSA